MGRFALSATVLMGWLALLAAIFSLGACALLAWLVGASRDGGVVTAPALLVAPVACAIAAHHLLQALKRPPATIYRAIGYVVLGFAGVLLGPVLWEFGYSQNSGGVFSLGTSRGCCERQVLGDIRSLLSAQAAYKDYSGHYDGRLQCLAAPWECLPRFDLAFGNGSPMPFINSCLASPEECQPGFLDGPVHWLLSQRRGRAIRFGYERTFYPGDPVVAPADGASRTSVRTYAYVAVPVEGDEIGIRSFCVDDTGWICAVMDGSTPMVDDGRCVEGKCLPIQ